MLKASEGLPLNVYLMLPSCVPATPFDEPGAVLGAKELRRFYKKDRVLGLGEVMNYPGVINKAPEVVAKLSDAAAREVVIDGHAPLLSGEDLDKYISSGISTDHECSELQEAIERISKGQWVMIRQGTAARNLEGLIDLFDEPFCDRCLLVTDDRHVEDIMADGHIDNMIRLAAQAGKSPINAICMATINAAECFGLKHTGAVAPGYKADLLVLSDLEKFTVEAVFSGGEKVFANHSMADYEKPKVNKSILKRVKNSFHVKSFSPDDFHIEEKSDKCRIIKTVPGQLLTEEWTTDIHWDNNGIDINRDILKIAAVERHKNTGHFSVGFISGIGLKKGAIATSVLHDTHNIVAVGASDADMAFAVNCVIQSGGGAVCVQDEKILAQTKLSLAGLMSEESAEAVAESNEELQKAICSLGASEGTAPLMTMSFMGLAVIPELKITTKGLVNVNKQEIVSLFAEEEI